MAAPEHRSADLARLSAITREFAVATADFATEKSHASLTDFLSRVRDALGMDIAFVAQVVDDRRVFRVTSAASGEPCAVVPGNSDPLVDSYCKRIIEGHLPRAIPDTSAVPEVSHLPITQRLAIGAYLSVPIVLPNGEVFGTLCCFSHSPRKELGQRDVDALQDVANAIAASIDRSGQIRGKIWAG